MTAMDELRAMLSERGTEYDETFEDGADYIWWSDGERDLFARFHHGALAVYGLSAQQAIVATLGAGTCHITPKFTCSECGHQYPTRNYESYETCDGRTAFAPLGYNVLACKKPNYCPNCGRKVTS